MLRPPDSPHLSSRHISAHLGMWTRQLPVTPKLMPIEISRVAVLEKHDMHNPGISWVFFVLIPSHPRLLHETAIGQGKQSDTSYTLSAHVLTIL